MPTRTTTLRAVQRAMEDEELQSHLRNAFVAARKLNDTLGSRRDSPRLVGLATDRRAQSQLRELVDELGATAGRITSPKATKRRHRLRTLIVALGAIAAVVMIVRRRMRVDSSAQPSHVSNVSPA